MLDTVYIFSLFYRDSFSSYYGWTSECLRIYLSYFDFLERDFSIKTACRNIHSGMQLDLNAYSGIKIQD